MPQDEEKVNSQDKMRRIAVGATVAGILLGVFLVIVLIIQFAQMGVRSAEEKRLDKSIAEYEEIIDKAEKDLDDYLTGDGLYYLALMRGWKSR